MVANRFVLGLACIFLLAVTAGQGRGQGWKAFDPHGRPSYTEDRNNMVDEEIVGAGVKNPRVIAAMRATPRHEFVPLGQRANSYFDMALPIGEGQTISPPFIVAYMTEAIDPHDTDTVLEIGTGSGYQAAVLSGLVKEVYTIEIVAPLGHKAAKLLERLHYANVHVKVGDGYQGWEEHAPFDKIIVTCSPEKVPPALVEQLKEGGRMVIPVGQRYQQTLYLLKKKNGKMESETLLPTLFVPMTGAAEARRQVKPDPARPALENGDFEEITGDPRRPVAWHYQRQLEIVTGEHAPSGKSYARFHNVHPGRGAQALQAFAIDGRKVKGLDISLQVQGQNIRPGQSAQQLPMLGVIFYDENRGTLTERMIGPWRGTFAWQSEKKRIEVPMRAREAIVRVGMFGAVGEFCIDDVQVKAAGKGSRD
jgi:protein-L-isoaspartate(D-aspartate) O-methyltransferase